MYTIKHNCRICNSPNLEHVLSLGDQELTGVFPCNKDITLTKGGLDLIWCKDCGLLQMKQSYDLGEMYGDNYGYRSGLNQSMVDHLTKKIHMLECCTNLKPHDLVVDIGSNDATSLKAYTVNCTKVGIDPTGVKFWKYYPDNIDLIADFFTADKFRNIYPDQKAKIVTSIAMFYDLEDPTTFVKDVAAILEDDGIWHFEQSYIPAMLQALAYDTICHEHLEFYSFRVVKNLLESCGMVVIDVELNKINGGSFAVTACKKDAAYTPDYEQIDWLLAVEDDMALDTLRPYKDFERKVYQHRNALVELLTTIRDSGKTVFGYGASTKGNVMLQFCGITPDLLPCIADVNEDKHGCFTPGTHIPIISEDEARALKPDYFLVLPWHFKEGILKREKAFRERGGKFIFPLPVIEVV